MLFMFYIILRDRFSRKNDINEKFSAKFKIEHILDGWFLSWDMTLLWVSRFKSFFQRYTRTYTWTENNIINTPQHNSRGIA